MDIQGDMAAGRLESSVNPDSASKHKGGLKGAARHDFQRALQQDRRRRVQAEGSTIEGLMAAGRVKEAWDHLVRW